MSVYFIQAGPKGPIKIGTALRPMDRLRELQVGNPFKLVLLAVIEGHAVVERELHAQFAVHRLRGEWFAPVPELIKLIQASRPFHLIEIEREQRAPEPAAGKRSSPAAAPAAVGRSRRQICAEDDTEVCPTCAGAGRPDWDNWIEPCPECDGAGEVRPGHVRQWRTAVVGFDHTILEVLD